MDKSKNSISEKDRVGKVILALSVCIVVLIYWRWLLPGAITWGDWWYLSPGALSDIFPFTWNSIGNCGGFNIFGIPFFPVLILEYLLSNLFHLNFNILERLLIFYPLILILIVSPWIFSRVLGYRRIGTAATILVFNLNSYIFLISGVTTQALAVALGPLVVGAFIYALRKPGIKTSILLALAASLQIIFDARIFYVISAFCCLYLLYYLTLLTKVDRRNLWRIFSTLFLSVIVVCLLHSYWIILMLFEKFSGGAVAFTLPGYESFPMVRVLSYSKMLNVLALHSPFWGKVNVLNIVNPHFLFLPFLVFGTLLFRKNHRNITFFAMNAIIFVFLVKGSNPPFGEVYIWLFKYFPGFVAFRVPGKWYMPVMISYAAMFGFLSEELGLRCKIWLKKKPFRNNPLFRLSSTITCIVIFFVIFPINPISTLHYSGIFGLRTFPEEYNRQDSFLHSQPDFFRILWVPRLYRFGYISSQHPPLNAIDLGNDLFSSLRTGNITKLQYQFSYLGQHFSTSVLRLLSIKYVIVPSAPQGDIADYYWHELPPKYYHNLLKMIPGASPISFKGKSKIYSIPNPLPHLYISSRSHLISGNYNDTLPILPRMDCMNTKKPLLVLTEQNSRLDSSLLNSKDFILQDKNFKDLAIELVESFKIPLQVTPNENDQKLKIKINHSGIYELWIDSSKIPLEPPRSIFLQVAIDKRILYNSDLSFDKKKEENYEKYLKLCELNLKKGDHKLEINIKDAEFKQTYLLTMLLADKANRTNMDNLIIEKLNKAEKNISYTFTGKIKWVKLKLLDKAKSAEIANQEPKIIFKKVNQTKYIVQIKGAKNPFWLTFLESFHPQWKLYLSKETQGSFDIIKDYEDLGVKEARYKLKFSLADFKYFFRKSLAVDNQHFLMNFYANGWYIEPEKLGLPEDFTIVLFFLPQSLFCIGIMISGFVLTLCIVYLIFCRYIGRNNLLLPKEKLSEYKFNIKN